MATSPDKIDELRNSLTEALGTDTLAVLSSQEEDRPFLGVETLAAFASYLALKFAAAFLKELKDRIVKEVENAGKVFADAVFNRVLAAAAKLKLFKPTQPQNAQEAKVESEAERAAIADAAEAVKKAKAISPNTASLEEAVKAAKPTLIAELKAKGFSEEEAVAKADKFVRIFMAAA